MKKESQIIIYESKDGKVKIDVRMGEKTLWLTQAQIAKLFMRDVSGVSRHIKNILDEGEVDKKKQFAIFANCKFR